MLNYLKIRTSNAVIVARVLRVKPSRRFLPKVFDIPGFLPRKNLLFSKQQLKAQLRVTGVQILKMVVKNMEWVFNQPMIIEGKRVVLTVREGHAIRNL